MAQPKPLIGPGDIIVDSWLNFTANLRTYGEFTVFFVFLEVARWAMITLVTKLIDDRMLRLTLSIVLSLPVFFLYAVLTVGLLSTVASHLRGKKAGTRGALSVGFHKVFPAIWVGILVGLFVMLGFIAFVIPGILFIVWYRFSQDFVVVDDVRGMEAVRASRRLVSGRWWATFARIIVPAVFYFAAAEFVSYVASLLAGSVLGDPGIFFGQPGTALNLPSSYLLVGAIIASAVKGLSLPLYLGSDLILWFDLKRTS